MRCLIACVDVHVSTHSRPKAAGSKRLPLIECLLGFNTQPPEGGWGAAVSGLGG